MPEAGALVPALRVLEPRSQKPGSPGIFFDEAPMNLARDDLHKAGGPCGFRTLVCPITGTQPVLPFRKQVELTRMAENEVIDTVLPSITQFGRPSSDPKKIVMR